MDRKAVQDFYSDEVSVCYGCGRLNEHGLQIKSYWQGDELICSYRPKPYHTAIPGYVYGGLIASLIDCHSTGTAAATAYRMAGRDPGSEPPFRFVTASLHVDYLKPTPIDSTLIIRANVKKEMDRKAIVVSSLYSNELLCVRGEVVVVQMPDGWLSKLTSS